MADSPLSTENETTHSAGSLDPHAISSIAVTVEDVIAALEANRSADRGAVLRITPPFAGRMRARLHIAGGEGTYDGDSEPIHLDPELLVDELPAYPTADGTADPTASSESNRRRHTERVEAWRETVHEQLREEITVSHAGQSLTMRVLPLG